MTRLWRSEGFSLIELMIVVAIIGVLAAIALASFQNLTESAQIASEDGVIGALNSAGVIYLGKNGAVPDEAAVRAAATPPVADLGSLTGVPNIGHAGVSWCTTAMFVTASTAGSHPSNHLHTTSCP